MSRHPAAASKLDTSSYYIHKVIDTNPRRYFLTYTNPSNETRMREIIFAETTEGSVNTLIDSINNAESNPNSFLITVSQTKQSHKDKFPIEPAQFAVMSGSIEVASGKFYLGHHDIFQIVANRHHDQNQDEADQRFCRDQVKEKLEEITLEKLRANIAQSLDESQAEGREAQAAQLGSLMAQLGLSEAASAEFRHIIEQLQREKLDLMTENVALRDANIVLQTTEAQKDDLIASLMTEVKILKKAEAAKSEAGYMDVNTPQQPGEDDLYMSITGGSSEVATLQAALEGEQTAHLAAKQRIEELERDARGRQAREEALERMLDLQRSTIERLQTEASEARIEAASQKAAAEFNQAEADHQRARADKAESEVRMRDGASHRREPDALDLAASGATTKPLARASEGGTPVAGTASGAITAGVKPVSQRRRRALPKAPSSKPKATAGGQVNPAATLGAEHGGQ